MGSTYLGQIVEQVNLVTENCGPVLLYGENIDTGSRISGLARGLKVSPLGRILNVGNCELTHLGVGFGTMVDGGSAVLFMKQLDFLPLGVDQLINTLNFVRSIREPGSIGSFTIFVIICDQGYQGPQSSINSAGDFASMANVNVYCLNGSVDASSVIRDQFVTRGFRIVCLSQRFFSFPALELPAATSAEDNSIFKYRSGNDVTLVCYNFALRDGSALAARLETSGIGSDLFHVNYVPGMDDEVIAESCRRTRRMVLIDDSKSVLKFGDMLVSRLRSRDVDFRVLPLIRRGCGADGYGVSEDQFRPDYEAVLAFSRD